ncbi:MAG: tRNA pseudouridine(38-40) synthase TruA [Gammaproteobacteria bacterium]|nr:tRNA pseudouridine(38-40) synthase TruA [Gammaproteobacteria bacterium]
MRIALKIEYDGSEYHGWQAQQELRTVQYQLEQALSKVANEPIEVVCAGRTDTGVHATHQIVHFDTENHRSLRAWIHGTNSSLPKDMCVRNAFNVTEDFHARYTATFRRYRYVIFNSSIRPGLLRSHVSWQYRHLDHSAMNKSAQVLLGEHDFTSFRSVECQSKTPMRDIKLIKVFRSSHFVVIDISANAFLHHMVRNIAGVLMAVGTGKQPEGYVTEVLEAKDRRLGAETASPYGLYLVGVTYPEQFNIPAETVGPWFLF